MKVNPFRDGHVPVWVCQLIWAGIFLVELAWCFVRFVKTP